LSLIQLYRQGVEHPQAQVCAQCGVRQFALFGALPDAELDRIHTHIADQPIAAGGMIYDLGQAPDAVYTVRSGVVRMERINERGDRCVVRLAGRGDLLGMEALLMQPYAAAAIACTEVQVCRIPRQLVAELSARQPAVVTRLMERWQHALGDAEEWLAELSVGPARRRMLRLLLKLSELAAPAPKLWLPSREDMGVMLNMTIETASRIVSALRRESVLLDVEGRRARIDAQALQAALRSADL